MSTLTILKKQNKTTGFFKIFLGRGNDLICSWESMIGESLETFESRIHAELMENASEYISLDRETNFVIDNRIGTDEVPVQEPSKEDRERLMYGFTVAELKEDYLQWNPADDPRSMLIRAMGILSDVQERISRDSITDEEIRQALNQSKFWISETKTQIPRDGIKPHFTDDEQILLWNALGRYREEEKRSENRIKDETVRAIQTLIDRLELSPEVREAKRSPSCTCEQFLPSLGLHAPDCPLYVKTINEVEFIPSDRIVNVEFLGNTMLEDLFIRIAEKLNGGLSNQNQYLAINQQRFTGLFICKDFAGEKYLSKLSEAGQNLYSQLKKDRV